VSSVIQSTAPRTRVAVVHCTITGSNTLKDDVALFYYHAMHCSSAVLVKHGQQGEYLQQIRRPKESLNVWP
jgi:hypothetical protein